MKGLLAALAITVCAGAPGCGAGEGSSDGLVWHLLRCRPTDMAEPEEIQEAEDALRALPSKVPIIQRLEWGKIDNSSTPNTHLFLLTFQERPSGAAGREYRDALYEAAGRYMKATPVEFVVRDATPHARTATRGHLRHVELFFLKVGIAPEEIQHLEDNMAALPSKIPAIERLQWGMGTDYNRPPGAQDFERGCCLMITFKDANARDAGLSHPAYQDFRKVLEQYASGVPHRVDYIARGAGR